MSKPSTGQSRHPQVDPDMADAARHSDMPTGGTVYSEAGTGQDSSMANIYLYAGIGIFLLVAVALFFFTALR